MSGILIIDDHPVVVAAIRYVISGKFPNFTVISAGNASDAKEFLNNLKEHDSKILLAFIDLQLPDGDGVELIRELHIHYRIPVVAISGRTDNAAIAVCIQNGAVGFVQKSSKLSAYSSAAQAVLCGGQYFPNGYIDGRSCMNLNNARNLTERQKQVLELVAAGKPNKIIARELCLAEGTVRNHVSDLFTIFQVTSRSQLVLATLDSSVKHQTM